MDDTLQNALKKAKEEIERSGITDLELKKIAFSKAVDFYLKKEKMLFFQGETLQEEDKAKINFWNELSVTVDFDEIKLKDVYSLKEDQVLLVVSSVVGNLKATKQRNLAALILFAYHKGLKYEWIASGLLAKAADHSKLYDASHFAKNLRSKETNWFSMKGKKKGLTYKLSGPGMFAAKELLNSLLNNK